MTALWTVADRMRHLARRSLALAQFTMAADPPAHLAAMHMARIVSSSRSIMVHLRKREPIPVVNALATGALVLLYIMFRATLICL